MLQTRANTIPKHETKDHVLDAATRMFPAGGQSEGLGGDVDVGRAVELE